MSSAVHSGGRLSPVGSSPFDVVVIVASQGGFGACRAIAGALTEDFPAALVYLQHRAPSATSALTALLRRSTAMPVVDAAPGLPLEAGSFYVAPARGRLRVVDGRFEIGDPDSVDACPGNELLRSVAAGYGERAIAVVLTGRLNDGAAGAAAIKAAGGRVLVQDPASADAASMPAAVLATGCFDLVLEPRRIAEALVALVSVPGAAALLAVRAHPWASTAA